MLVVLSEGSTQMWRHKGTRHRLRGRGCTWGTEVDVVGCDHVSYGRDMLYIGLYRAVVLGCEATGKHEVSQPGDRDQVDV